MTNHDVLEKFLDIQRDTLMSRNHLVASARLTINDFDQSPFWNYCLVNNMITDKELSDLRDKFTQLNRKPALYFEHTDKLKPLETFLLDRKFKNIINDSWMFFDTTKPPAIDEEKSDSIKTVESIDTLDLWIQTMDQSYRPDDPKNPFGQLGHYLDLAKQSWIKNHKTGEYEYYLAYKGDIPVAVATLTIKKDFAYISNVGSIIDVRSQSYGKAITLFCVQKAIEAGINNIALATEEGTYPNEFYKRIGFSTRFIAKCYSL